MSFVTAPNRCRVSGVTDGAKETAGPGGRSTGHPSPRLRGRASSQWGGLGTPGAVVDRLGSVSWPRPQTSRRLLESMPDGLSPFVLAIVPTPLTFAAGWQAKHTPLDDGIDRG
ncbi:hypothetical protein DVH02_11385 [Streptomyces corynorhini]|uniref:Uncharacterized protein n=1 Tax=Streptomyces corynorhini TaxID=2282652 RepID=A0A370BCC6_9ACTN|nr:hypothetical protein DVH02_11385 [Streptomyces corynorhini]